ncbi:TnsA endonuclease N-terminal domain-containing protein [Ralstonia pseudosolanacearum]|uniref:TnsA endonuclease N-terminal domain-containing protein n=1 Tax=Ralstonia pseudosolanacearum TaxID=1310165 RepID=UPI0018D0558E|nr:TnsA endonuclease N-terminal domain-containing protein [Ralstonia pseudosolanacearum]UWD90367.1 TnsA endonuclease N-terminal domain-containing protein [Ralstonia pseudosolanacearum]
MPAARKVVTRSPHRRVGLIACPWFQPTPIEYESLLERDFVRLALLDLQISSISHQPFSLNLGELGTYFPDFLLVGPDKKVVVEVKPDHRAHNAKNKPRLECAKQLLGEKGFQFVVATEKQIRRGKRHDRASVLLRHARSHVSQVITARIIAAASHSPKGISIRDLACEASTSVETVLHLIGRRRLRINTAFDFDEDKLVYPVGGVDVDLHP